MRVHLKADDQTGESARQNILLTVGEEEAGNGGQSRRGKRRRRGKSGMLELAVGL